MTILNILKYPEKSLGESSLIIKRINNEIKVLVDNMAETMVSSQGIGLAAPQVGINKRVIIYNPCVYKSDDNKIIEKAQEFKAIINPEIISSQGSVISRKEACLSVPDYNSDVKRFEKITIKGLNIDEQKIQFNAEGIQAVIIQHEIDHLNGILFIDRISLLKRRLYIKKVKKIAQ
ncbi:MAG: peptide deformylase [Desulfobacteraceae bacterium 4572_130]|nr:MAG: peptide deformylase [Desulfobacteraceae bacterium 4572_130]